jgi:hypothetical protein
MAKNQGIRDAKKHNSPPRQIPIIMPQVRVNADASLGLGYEFAQLVKREVWSKVFRDLNVISASDLYYFVVFF